jgi:hypothetical protein
MPTSRNTPESTETSGFTEDQRSELRSIIAEVVGAATPPAAPATSAAGPKQLSDSEWDALSDRQRESWVRQLVDFRLDELARDDEVARQRGEIDALKADRTPEPEAPPSVVTKLQRFLWGDPDNK